MQKKVMKNFLIDLDGVILNLDYDNFFWQKHIPKVYAELHKISFKDACLVTKQIFNYKRKTKDWYDIDYWSNMLNVDIKKEKEDNIEKIDIMKGAVEFLESLVKKNKNLFLITNAHEKTLKIKLKKYNIKKYFKDIICSHQLSYIKEEIQFWYILKNKLNISFKNSVLIEDTLDNLIAAHSAGLENLIYISKEESKSRIINPLTVKSLSDLSSTF